MKKLLSVLLSLCLVLSLAVPAMAAPQASGAASTLRLESTEGTVQMKDGAGKTVKVSKGSRLYNGYSLSTQKSSYAFVSLDSSKAVKLDASTNATVFQSGKKLELTATTGQLFFNVSAPLKSDESLNIRTSTMVTGVRGTCGWVEISDRNTTRLSLLEGTLTVTSPDPVTGEDRTITIQGGQTLTVVYEGDGHGFDPALIGDNITIQDLIDQGIINKNNIILTGTGLTVEALQEEKVPGFVAVEVAKDKDLQKKIEETTDLSVPAIIEDAEERLAEEEAAAQKQDQQIQSDLENLSAEKTDPLFEETAEDTSGGGGSTSTPARGVVNSTSDTTTALNNELAQAAADGNDVVVSNTVSAGNDQTPVVVQPDQTMTLANGAVLDGGTYDVQGTLEVEDGATVENSSDIVVNSTNSLEISGTLVNYGNIYIGETTPGALRILSGGQLINNGTIYIGSETAATATGLLEIQSGGSITSEGDGILQVGAYEEAGATGTMTVASGATVTCDVNVTEFGTMTNDGTITGYVSNYGILTNNGTINGYVENGGTLNHYGTICGGGSNGAVIVEANSTTLISGATVQDDYHAGGSGSQIGSSDGYAIVLMNGSSDPNAPVKVTIEDGSLIQSTGAAISSRDSYSGVTAYGFNITIKDSTVKSNSYAIDGSTFGSGSYYDEANEEYIPVTSAINITNSTLVGGTAAINENASAVTITMDAATEKNNNAAADALIRYTVYFHNNYYDTFTTPEGAAEAGAPSDEFVGGIPKVLSPSDWSDRNGYTQTGWNTKPDGTGTAYAINGTLSAPIVSGDESAIILYAQWAANSYTIRFDANGGTGSMEDQAFTFGASTLLSPNEFERDGYVFERWDYDAAGTYSSVSGDSAVSDLTAVSAKADENGVVTLYAQWLPIYTIIYHANDGTQASATVTDTFTPWADTVYTLANNSFTNGENFFAGWLSGTATSTYSYPAGEELSPNSVALFDTADKIEDHVIHFYASWVSSYTYSVVFRPNDGVTTDFTCSLLDIPHNAEITLSADPSADNAAYRSPTYKDNFERSGYTLKGWSTAADGSGTFYAVNAKVSGLSSSPTVKDVALYAQWEAITP